MATEEYKEIIKVLTKDYLTLKAEMKAEGYSDTALSLKDYLTHYASYEEAGLLSIDDQEDEGQFDDYDDEFEYDNTPSRASPEE